MNRQIGESTYVTQRRLDNGQLCSSSCENLRGGESRTSCLTSISNNNYESTNTNTVAPFITQQQRYTNHASANSGGGGSTGGTISAPPTNSKNNPSNPNAIVSSNANANSNETPSKIQLALSARSINNVYRHSDVYEQVETTKIVGGGISEQQLLSKSGDDIAMIKQQHQDQSINDDQSGQFVPNMILGASSHRNSHQDFSNEAGYANTTLSGETEFHLELQRENLQLKEELKNRSKQSEKIVSIEKKLESLFIQYRTLDKVANERETDCEKLKDEFKKTLIDNENLRKQLKSVENAKNKLEQRYTQLIAAYEVTKKMCEDYKSLLSEINSSKSPSLSRYGDPIGLNYQMSPKHQSTMPIGSYSHYRTDQASNQMVHAPQAARVPSINEHPLSTNQSPRSGTSSHQDNESNLDRIRSQLPVDSKIIRELLRQNQQNHLTNTMTASTNTTS